MIGIRISSISDLHKCSTRWHKFIMQFFADDKSLFSKVHNIDKSVTELNADLKKISQGPINEKCNLTLISINNQMKFFSLVNLIQQTFSIRLLSLIIKINIRSIIIIRSI